MDKSESWLLDKLEEAGYTDVSQIFIAEYSNGQLDVVSYD
ncbi:YetF domain-containing protein [Streptococcus hyointestinalis]